MKKIVILGCENSHAATFLKLIRENPDRYGDIAVCGVYSREEEAMATLEKDYGVPRMRHHADLAGKVDGVVITARNGEDHDAFALPYLAPGLALFLDKPITVKEEKALSLLRAYREKEVTVCGGSCCKHAEELFPLKAALAAEPEAVRGGFFAAPIQLESPYAGFFFYAQHLVDMILAVYGGPTAVLAAQNGKNVTVLFRYPGYDVVGRYAEGAYGYYATVDLGAHILGGAVSIGDACFRAEWDDFCRLLHGGKQETPYEDFALPVFVMNAIHRSLESGREEVLPTDKL